MAVAPTSPPIPSSILGLPVAAYPLGGGEWAVIVQNGQTVRVPTSQLILPGNVNSVAGGVGINTSFTGGIATVNLNVPVLLSNGGTGATSSAGARSNLGLGAAAVENLGGAIIDDGAGNLTIGTGVITGAMVGGSQITGNKLSLAQAQNILGADVNLTDTTLFFDGPSVNVGTVGTWAVFASILVQDPTGGGASFNLKLWDGTTIIRSSWYNTSAGMLFTPLTLSGFVTNPTGNLRISVKDVTSTSGTIVYNQSGNAKDSSIWAFRIG